MKMGCIFLPVSGRKIHSAGVNSHRPRYPYRQNRRAGCRGRRLSGEAFALEELHARIRALLRRHNNQGESELNVGNLTLNMGRRQVWMSGEELILTPKEYALLSRLMLKAGSPVHREILYNDIYNWDNEPSTNTWKCISITCATKWAKPVSAPCADLAICWSQMRKTN